jgi:diketogulonate reductase-like aldo/keto reductase
MDYVDLYLMHWPVAFKPGDEVMPKVDGKMQTADIDYVDTYKAMENLVKIGKAKAIGVSNFSQKELERVLKGSSIVPAVVQMELHPWLQQKAFCQFIKSKGIHITQYSPFGNQNEVYDSGKHLGKLIVGFHSFGFKGPAKKKIKDEPILAEIGKKYNKTSAQVVLAWGIAHGNSVIPKSKTPARIRENLGGDFRLDPADVEKIDAMDKKIRLNDPSDSFQYNFFEGLDGK